MNRVHEASQLKLFNEEMRGGERQKAAQYKIGSVDEYVLARCEQRSREGARLKV